MSPEGPPCGILVVDNGSSDGSVRFLREHFPEVDVLALDSNSGFARACNLGARHAQTPIVAFLNNDIKVDARWLLELVRPLDRSERIICTGSRVLSWKGDTADFEGGDMNLEGRAFQKGFGLPPHRDLTSTTVAYANGGAMAILRDVFIEVGGFDEDFFAYYEDSDLGWRLWVLGYQVLFVPASVCYHRHHGTSSTLSAAQMRFLLERNALLSVLKNYSADTLRKVFPLTLLLTLRRALRYTGTDAAGYVPPRQYDGPPVENVPAEAMAHLLALQDVALSMATTLGKAESVQSARGRPDEEVLAQFGKYLEPTVGGRAYRVRQRSLVRVLGVRTPQPRRARKKVLVVSPDLVPLEGAPATGSGLRAWSLGKGLEARGHDVVFSMPRRALARWPEVSGELQDLGWDEETLAPLVREVAPDVVVACGWSILTHLPDPPHPVALDFHGPHVLERFWQGHLTPAENAEEKLAAISRADFFTCAGDRQRTYFLSWLMQAGIDPEDTVIQQIPVSLSPDLPAHTPSGEGIMVFGGVFLPWQNPSVAIEAALAQMNRSERGKLLLFGGRHPFLDLDQGVYAELVRTMKQHPRVEISRMVPREDLLRTYAKADAALDAMKWNLERELAFTTRTVEYLWCGLPVVYNDYADLSRLIAAYEAGWTVDPEDKEQVASAVEQLLTDPEEAARRGVNAQRLVRERLTWDRTVDPLDAFCRDPVFRRHEGREPFVAREQTGAAELRRMLRDKEVHIRNLEAMLARRRSPVARAFQLLGRARHHLAAGGARGLVRQSLRFLQHRLRRNMP
jgi:GT2 family glycosyltransferase/glycosyltransferase involved in cell wall biosynthesis